MTYDFAAEREAWRCVPVDDAGYFDARVLLTYTSDALRMTVNRMATVRYSGWRNHGNLWRDTLGLDDTTGKVVLDFGCGIGLEALQFAKLGNDVMLADVNYDSVQLAARVLQLHGFAPRSMLLTSDEPPYVIDPSTPIDVFYANGVLHHLAYDVELLDRVAEILSPNGEVRLLLYSDLGWTVATRTPPPLTRACDHPSFRRFVDFFDGMNGYSDFYSLARLEERFGHRYDVTRFKYITPDSRFCTTTLVPR